MKYDNLFSKRQMQICPLRLPPKRVPVPVPVQRREYGFCISTPLCFLSGNMGYPSSLKDLLVSFCSWASQHKAAQPLSYTYPVKTLLRHPPVKASQGHPEVTFQRDSSYSVSPHRPHHLRRELLSGFHTITKVYSGTSSNLMHGEIVLISIPILPY